MFREKVSGVLVVASALLALATVSFGQGQNSPFDIQHYKIDATISPDLNRLDAVVDVEFIPLKDTRSVTFELNGSLEIEKIDLVSKVNSTPVVENKTPIKTTPAPITFVQDRVGVSELGPSVRVDLGEVVPKGTRVTIKFKYGGILASAQGGPLLTKRLAYVGPDDGYLMYAARWFPFHEYAADKATSEIVVNVPGTYQVVGVSDEPVLTTFGKQRFVVNKPTLPGNFTYGRYVNKTLRYSDFELNFRTKGGVDEIVAEYGQTLGAALSYYAKQYGIPSSGKKLIVSQIDDDSLEYYSQEGILFLANRHFDEVKDVVKERLQREAALQWWGLTVGLKSFDDAWLSQGLAEYSAYQLRESQLTGAKLDELRRELLEKALTFEQTASLARTPASLDDQSVAYRYIMYSKGALVFKLLRDTIGTNKFDMLMRNYLAKYRDKNASISDFEDMADEIAVPSCGTFLRVGLKERVCPSFRPII